MKKLFDILSDSFGEGTVQTDVPDIDFFDPMPTGSIEFIGEVKDRYARNIFCHMANVSKQTDGMFHYATVNNVRVLTVKSESELRDLKSGVLITEILGSLFNEHMYTMSKSLAIRVGLSESEIHLTQNWRVILSLAQSEVEGVNLSEENFPIISPSDSFFTYVVESFVTPSSKFRLSNGVKFILPPVVPGDVVLRKLIDDRLVNLFVILSCMYKLFNDEVDKLREIESSLGQKSFEFIKKSSFLERLKEQCDLAESIFWHSVKDTVADANEFDCLAVKENLMLVGFEQ